LIAAARNLRRSTPITEGTAPRSRRIAAAGARRIAISRA
jgi:hypothetical protein